MEFWLNVIWFLAGCPLKGRSRMVDCSNVTFIKSFALVYLGLSLMQFKRNGERVEWIPPSSRAVRNYLKKQQFHERFYEEELPDESSRMGLITRSSLEDIILIASDEKQAEQLGVKVQALLDTQSTPIELDTASVHKQVKELALNFIGHSGVGDAVFHCQYHPKLHEFHFSFGDIGRGVRASLATSSEYADLADMPHEDCLEKAVQEDVSSRPGGGGYGLPELVSFTKRYCGILLLTSETGCYVVAPKGVRKGRLPFSLPGLQVGVVVPMRSRNGDV